jgi:hypothetical protein|tara:strand:+ start:329 stop:520 length:192 start_codon:yes stop_codon:yes gene_type:complete
MSHKEAYRYFWMVKGHFETSESTVLSCAEQYFMRCWRAGCDGAPLSEWEEGFEVAYKEKFNLK